MGVITTPRRGHRARPSEAELASPIKALPLRSTSLTPLPPSPRTPPRGCLCSQLVGARLAGVVTIRVTGLPELARAALVRPAGAARERTPGRAAVAERIVTERALDGPDAPPLRPSLAVARPLLVRPQPPPSFPSVGCCEEEASGGAAVDAGKTAERAPGPPQAATNSPATSSNRHAPLNTTPRVPLLAARRSKARRRSHHKGDGQEELDPGILVPSSLLHLAHRRPPALTRASVSPQVCPSSPRRLVCPAGAARERTPGRAAVAERIVTERALDGPDAPPLRPSLAVARPLLVRPQPPPSFPSVGCCEEEASGGAAVDAGKAAERAPGPPQAATNSPATSEQPPRPAGKFPGRLRSSPGRPPRA
nr:uncharacterized protein LOC127315698 [Lolium perenne]